MPKRSKSATPGVVPGLEPRASAPVPVAVPRVRRSKCYVHPDRAATQRFYYGPFSVEVCDKCYSGIKGGVDLAGFLKSFL